MIGIQSQCNEDNLRILKQYKGNVNFVLNLKVESLVEIHIRGGCNEYAIHCTILWEEKNGSGCFMILPLVEMTCYLWIQSA